MGASESREPVRDVAVEEKECDPMKELAKVAALVAVGFIVWKVCSNSSRAKMKAPVTGGTSYIYRHDFERDPADYFRRLRHD